MGVFIYYCTLFLGSTAFARLLSGEQWISCVGRFLLCKVRKQYHAQSISVTLKWSACCSLGQASWNCHNHCSNAYRHLYFRSGSTLKDALDTYWALCSFSLRINRAEPSRHKSLWYGIHNYEIRVTEREYTITTKYAGDWDKESGLRVLGWWRRE